MAGKYHSKPRDVVCVVCGKTFVAYKTGSMYCSDACNAKACYARNAERKRAAARMRPAAGLSLPHRSPVGPPRDVACIVCGKTFIGYRSTAKYCTNACQKKAGYWRQRPEHRVRLRMKRSEPKYVQYNLEYQRGWRARNREKLRQQSRDWYARNAEQERLRDRFKKYGVTPDQFLAMREEQNGICAICRLAPTTDLDHDHKTKQVRSLLCNKCNVGLGSFNDEPDLLEAAAAYLRMHRERLAREA